MLIQNTIAGYDIGALTMVKNTPTATTTTVRRCPERSRR